MLGVHFSIMKGYSFLGTINLLIALYTIKINAISKGKQIIFLIRRPTNIADTALL